jgi:hypothetical protein
MLRKKAAWSCSRFYLGNLFRVLWLVQCILLHDVNDACSGFCMVCAITANGCTLKIAKVVCCLSS